jgi:hypothetical protein
MLLQSLEQFGPMILLELVVSGATRYIVGPMFEVLTAAYIALVRLFL